MSAASSQPDPATSSRPAVLTPHASPVREPTPDDLTSVKVSVSMPRRVVDEIKQRVGPREFSGYLTEAAERKLELDRLDDLLVELQKTHGPVPEELLRAAEAAWPDAQ